MCLLQLDPSENVLVQNLQLNGRMPACTFMWLSYFHLVTKPFWQMLQTSGFSASAVWCTLT